MEVVSGKWRVEVERQFLAQFSSGNNGKARHRGLVEGPRWFPITKGMSQRVVISRFFPTYSECVPYLLT